MFTVIKVALLDLKKRKALALVLSILFGVSFASYLSLVTYQKSLTKTYFSLNDNWLVVQQSFGSGEIHGSRLTKEVKDVLVNKGYYPIPEIHQVVGTSLSNGIMIRGVKPEDLHKVIPFRLIKGHSITIDGPSRIAMVGIRLAERLKIYPGDPITLRGREFTVAGIFSTGSYEDNQAWITLEDAQKLLNYGDDVSIYFIPDDGTLLEGTSLETGISIGRRGDTGYMYGREVMDFFNFLGLIASFSGIATMVTLANILWRLSWLHRREFGILRTLGFGRFTVGLYTLSQAGVIMLSGVTLGTLFAVTAVFPQIREFSAFGISLNPVWDLKTICIIVIITLMITLAGIILPTRQINKNSIPSLLGRE